MDQPGEKSYYNCTGVICGLSGGEISYSVHERLPFIIVVGVVLPSQLGVAT